MARSRTGGSAAGPACLDTESGVSKVNQQRVWLVCLTVLVGGLVTLGIFSLKANYANHGNPVSPPIPSASTPSR